MKYQNVHILTVMEPLSSCEHSAREAARYLKKEGFKAKTGPSTFVGYRNVILSFNRVLDLQKALKFLKSWGYIDSVSEARKDISLPLPA